MSRDHIRRSISRDTNVEVSALSIETPGLRRRLLRETIKAGLSKLLQIGTWVELPRSGMRES